MADVNDSIDGSVINLEISTALVTPVWKTVVCSTEDIGIAGATEGSNTVNTRCGVKKSKGRASWSISGSGAANRTVGGTEMSADELLTLFQDKTDFLVRVQDDATPADYYRSGQGVLSEYNETSPIDGIVGFDFNIEVSGDLDITP